MFGLWGFVAAPVLVFGMSAPTLYGAVTAVAIAAVSAVTNPSDDGLSASVE